MRCSMRHLLLSAVLISLVPSIAGCGRAAPDAGEEAVLIAKPWFFGHGGVGDEAIKAGLTYTSWTTSSVYVNVQPQMIKEHFVDIMSSDGVPLSFDSYTKFQVIDSVSLVKGFGGQYDDIKDEHSDDKIPYWYAMNLQGPIRNIIRSAIKKHGLNEVAITYAADAELEAEIKPAINSYLLKMNIPIRLVDFSIGKANPPDAVRNQRVRTAAEQQRQITEHQTKLAEDARKAAEEARAAADNAYRLALGLSPEQFIQLESINMQKSVCGKLKSGCAFVSPGNSAIINLH
jgi:regulator of protease activity HflC (stomatin/prohibitin superfamily)